MVSYKARTHAMVKPHGEGGVEAGTMALHIERGPEHGANSQTEALGTQTVEGVEAAGTRTTTTIAAGTIGNEQPIKIVSEEGLWRGMDARVVDGAVNGTGQLVAGSSAILRLFQNGSVKAYAASTFVGVVAILAYYIWR